jgi:flavin reductase (DIM6/NTAB) family NADH-FMN oxidoreductase RutF
MIVDPAERPWREVYHHLTDVVQPRPIAFVSTVSAAGLPNLAPFSFYNAISGNPPFVCFSPQLRGRDGEKKDTLRNVEETEEFVVATVTEAIAERMNLCSAEFSPEVNEFEAAGFTPIPSLRVRPARVAESPVNLECRLHQIVRLGDGPGAGSLIIGRVVMLHLDDALLVNGRVASERLQAVGRMGGSRYARTDSTFDMARPELPG